MKTTSTMIVLVAALAVTSTGLGLSFTDIFDDDGVITQSNTATGLMMGHLTVEAHNEMGELIAYRQTDNEVVDDGEQCILKMLFATSAGGGNTGRGEYTSGTIYGGGNQGNGGCSGALTGAWDVIGIGTDNDNGVFATGQSAATVDTLVSLGNETGTSKGLERGTATTKTWTNGTGATTTKIVLSKTFTSDSPRAHAIGESGLFNSTTPHCWLDRVSGTYCVSGAELSRENKGEGMLARQTFTDVTLSDGDSITITWTFTVGN